MPIKSTKKAEFKRLFESITASGGHFIAAWEAPAKKPESATPCLWFDDTAINYDGFKKLYTDQVSVKTRMHGRVVVDDSGFKLMIDAGSKVKTPKALKNLVRAFGEMYADEIQGTRPLTRFTESKIGMHRPPRPGPPVLDDVVDDGPKCLIDPVIVPMPNSAQIQARGGKQSLEEEGSSSYADLCIWADRFLDHYPRGLVPGDSLVNARSTLSKIATAAAGWLGKKKLRQYVGKAERAKVIKALLDLANDGIREMDGAEINAVIDSGPLAFGERDEVGNTERINSLLHHLTERIDSPKVSIPEKTVLLTQRAAIEAELSQAKLQEIGTLEMSQQNDEAHGAVLADLVKFTDDLGSKMQLESDEGYTDELDRQLSQAREALAHIFGELQKELYEPPSDDPAPIGSFPGAAAEKLARAVKNLVVGLQKMGEDLMAFGVLEQFKSIGVDLVSKEIKKQASLKDNWQGNLLRDGDPASKLFGVLTPLIDGKPGHTETNCDFAAATKVAMDVLDPESETTPRMQMAVTDEYLNLLHDYLKMAANPVPQGDKPLPHWDTHEQATTELGIVNKALMDAAEAIIKDMMAAMPTMPEQIKEMAAACFTGTTEITSEMAGDGSGGTKKTAYIAAQNVVVLRWMSVRMAVQMKLATRGKVAPMLNRVIQGLVQFTANQFVYESKLYPWSDEIGFIEAATVCEQYMKPFRDALCDAIGVDRVD